MRTIVKFKTETGSLYEIFRDDEDNLNWARLSEPQYEGDNPLRTKVGPLSVMPVIVENAPAIMIGPPLSEGMDLRAITTSNVISMEWACEKN